MNDALEPFPNIDAETMNAYKMGQDSSNPAKSGKPREAQCMKEMTVTEKVSEIPGDAAEESSGVSSKAVLSLVWNRQAADKAGKRRCNSIPGRGICEEQLAFALADSLRELPKEGSVAPEEDFSFSHRGSGAEREEMQCWEEVGLASEGSSASCASEGESTEAAGPMKPCYVLLENLIHERKAKQEYYLIPTVAKKLPPTMQNKAAVFKKLQVALYDTLDKSYMKKLKESQNLENMKALPENENANKTEGGVELNCSVKGLRSGQLDIGKGNTENEINKTPDISNLWDQGVFARFSLRSSNYEPIMNLCHVQKSEKDAGSLQMDYFLTPETQVLKTKSAEMLTECENNLGKQAERKGTCDETEDYGDLKIITGFSEASLDNASQFSNRNHVCISHREALQISSARLSETSLNEAEFSKTSVRHMEALPDKISHDGEVYQAVCDLDKLQFVCPLAVQDLNLDMKDMILGKIKGKMSTQRIVSDLKTLAEKVLDTQLDVEKELSRNSPLFRNKDLGALVLLLDTAAAMDEGVHMCVTSEEEFKALEHGDALLDGGISFPQSESKSTCLTPRDDVTLKNVEVREGRLPYEPNTACERETSIAEESVNPQPAEENKREEERPQPRQSQGVQMVFYELAESKVKLLGTPSDGNQMLNLELIGLNDSSDNKLPRKESQGSPAALRLSDQKGMLPSVSKSLHSDESRTKKKSQRLDTTPLCSSQLSQEWSRTKVVDALRGALRKRLDDFPDLNVPKNTVSKVAKKVEREIFRLFCCVNQQYKAKYRSLLFNLKSTENQHLFRRVLLGEITPKRLVQLSSLELAPKELAEWRAKENKRMLEIIEKEARETPESCSAKFTHKGVVEIHREEHEDLSFQEVSQALMEGDSSCEMPAAPVAELGEELCGRLRGSDSSSSGQKAAGSDQGFKPPSNKWTLNQKANVVRHLLPSTMGSERGGRPLRVASPTSVGVPKRHRRAEEQPGTVAIWKGLIQMFSVKQFLAEAYPVSGSSGHPCQGLPPLLASRGCIVPEEVWAYLDSVWPADRKEMGVIRFCPSSSKGVKPYSTLYSYLNSRQRYGIVDCSRMEMLLVPLAARQPVPSRLHAFGGPGLDPSHPSLLLGLILPKRACPLEPRPNPKPGPKRKGDTFKDRTEAKCLALSLSSEKDNSQRQQLSLDRLLCGNECGLAGLPGQEPLPVEAHLVLSEEIGGELLHGEPSSVHHKEASGEASQSPVSGAPPLLSGSPRNGRQLGDLALGILGAQPDQDAGQVQCCLDSDPSHFWDVLGLLVPSEQQCRAGESGFEDPFLPSMFCAEVVVPGEESQARPLSPAPCTQPAGEPSSLMEETLSLIQHLVQLQPYVQTQELLPAAASCPSFMPQGGTSALSPGEVGFAFLQAPLGEGTWAQQ